jgi:hypothetical protein
MWVEVGFRCRQKQPKTETRTQNKAKGTNPIDFLSRLCRQGVAGSIPATSTKSPRDTLAE